MTYTFAELEIAADQIRARLEIETDPIERVVLEQALIECALALAHLPQAD